MNAVISSLLKIFGSTEAFLNKGINGP